MKKRILFVVPVIAFVAYSLFNPRWFFHTFTPKTLHCGTVEALFLEGGKGYVRMLDKDLHRSVVYPVTMTRWANFRVGDYTCEELCEWEVNN